MYFVTRVASQSQKVLAKLSQPKQIVVNQIDNKVSKVNKSYQWKLPKKWLKEWEVRTCLDDAAEEKLKPVDEEPKNNKKNETESQWIVLRKLQ